VVQRTPLPTDGPTRRTGFLADAPLTTGWASPAEDWRECLDLHQALMSTLDAVNRRFDKQAIPFASVRKGQPWRVKQASKSPQYATRISDLPLVR
jgi:hypothetical protein